MRALLYKDLLLLWAQERVFVPLFVIVGIVDVFSPDSKAISLGILMIFNAASILLREEENYHWLVYAAASPISRKQVVTEKYLLNLLILGGTVVFYGLFRGAAGLLHGDMAGILRDYLYASALSFDAALLTTIFSMPLLFRNGDVKKNPSSLPVLIGSIVVTLLVGKVGTGVGSLLNVRDKELAGAILCTVLCLALYPVSWRLAVRWYGERELV